MSGPLESIEEEQAQRDLGVVAHRLVVGARSDGASWWVAFLIAAAWFRGLLTTEVSPEEDA